MKKVATETTTEVKTGAVLKKCSCQHGYQDEKYGKSIRVFTKSKSKYSCTVCGTSIKH